MYAVPRFVLTGKVLMPPQITKTEGKSSSKWRARTLFVHWHIKVRDFAVRAKDLAEMVFADILCELLDNNLSSISQKGQFESEGGKIAKKR